MTHTVPPTPTTTLWPPTTLPTRYAPTKSSAPSNTPAPSCAWGDQPGLRAGKTPSTTVRLPADIKVGVDARAAAENVKSAEIIRRAVVEYLERHPA